MLTSSIPISPLEAVLIVLFVSEVLEVWRHGNIFEDLKGWLEAGGLYPPGSFPDRLLSCMFCLGVWVSGAVVGLLALRPLFHSSYAVVLEFLLLTGSLIRAANLVHDFHRPYSRTPSVSRRAHDDD